MGFIGDIFSGIGDFIGDVVGGIVDFVGDAVNYVMENPMLAVAVGIGIAGYGFGAGPLGDLSPFGAGNGGAFSAMADKAISSVSNLFNGGIDTGASLSLADAPASSFVQNGTKYISQEAGNTVANAASGGGGMLSGAWNFAKENPMLTAAGVGMIGSGIMKGQGDQADAELTAQAQFDQQNNEAALQEQARLAAQGDVNAFQTRYDGTQDENYFDTANELELMNQQIIAARQGSSLNQPQYTPMIGEPPPIPGSEGGLLAQGAV
jgi:hypothetical protein